MDARLLVAGSSKETGELLGSCLESLGVQIEPFSQNVICYGLPWAKHSDMTYRDVNILNANCGTNKIERMRMMNIEGVLTPPWFEGNEYYIGDLRFPLLARKRWGFGGTDIVPVFQPEEIGWRVAAGWEWFSEYVPVIGEYRVWVFQGRVLDIYEKVMKRPEEFVYIGRNFRNGFEFELLDMKDTGAWEISSIAKKAVGALGLDFGAVDVIVGKDNENYVLEVNTAPGVIRSGAQGTLMKLAQRIRDWVQAK